MKKVLLALIISPILCFSQKNELIIYLDAYKTSEFTESKKIISDYSFGKEAKYTMLSYEEPSGIIFKTDIDGINGYKSIVNCKLENKGGGFSEKRMIAIMYINKKNNKWSVCEFRESVEPDYEFKISKERAENGDFYTGKQYVYRNLAYWAILSGKFKEAVNYRNLSIKEAEESNDLKFDSSNINSLIECING